jgi:N4-gp56 family major capsid protein
MAVTNTTTLNDLLPSIVREALFVASEKSIMRGLVRNYTLGAGNGKTVTVPIYPRQTATALTEATAGNEVEVSTSSAVLTVSEVGLYATISDLALMASASNVTADLGRLFGEAIARKIDTDILTKIKSFSTNTIGSASTTATPALLFQGIAKLRAQGYDTANDCAIVLHPNVAYDIASTLTSTFAAPAGMVGNEALRNGFMGTLGGVPVYQSSLVENITSAGDYACGIIHKDSLGFALMQDVKIESQREATLRGYQIVGSAIYGTGILYDNAGVYGLFDSSIE